MCPLLISDRLSRQGQTSNCDLMTAISERVNQSLFELSEWIRGRGDRCDTVNSI